MEEKEIEYITEKVHKKLEKRLIERGDERYVLKADCSETMEDVNKKFANDSTSIKLFEQRLNTWEWWVKLIATGVIGTLVTSILSLILK